MSKRSDRPRDVRVRARHDEEYQDALFVADRHAWYAFGNLAKRRGTTRSALIRRYIRWEISRERGQ